MLFRNVGAHPRARGNTRSARGQKHADTLPARSSFVKGGWDEVSGK